MHVLRLQAGEFVDPAQARPRVGEDGSDYPRCLSNQVSMSERSRSPASK